MRKFFKHIAIRFLLGGNSKYFDLLRIKGRLYQIKIQEYEPASKFFSRIKVFIKRKEHEKMQFPRKSMKTMELVNECGFKRSYLIQLAHMEGQKYATRLPGGRDIYWDTEKLGKQLEKLAVR